MTIGREHAAGTINDEGILDYSKNMAIVLLHSGPGYGKSHVLQCMRQMNDAYNLNSLVMAFSGTAASQFEGGKTSHGSCRWNVGKRYSAFKNISDNSMPSKIAMMGPQPSMIILDECSMIGQKMLAHISHSMAQIMNAKINIRDNLPSSDTLIVFLFLRHQRLYSYFILGSTQPNFGFRQCMPPTKYWFQTNVSKIWFQTGQTDRQTDRRNKYVLGLPCFKKQIGRAHV